MLSQEDKELPEVAGIGFDRFRRETALAGKRGEPSLHLAPDLGSARQHKSAVCRQARNGRLRCHRDISIFAPCSRFVLKAPHIMPGQG
jgi:hypothetical protein